MSCSPALRQAYQAVFDAGFIARNWSGGGELVLAVYSRHDCYYGQVTVTETAIRARGSWCKRDASVLQDIQQEYVKEITDDS